MIVYEVRLDLGDIIVTGLELDPVGKEVLQSVEVDNYEQAGYNEAGLLIKRQIND